MTTQNDLPIPVGILGGGQLGCMLMDAACRLGLNAKIFAEASSPAAVLFPDRWVEGQASSDAGGEEKLRRFFSEMTVVVFENEFLDCDLLERAARGLDMTFAPPLAAIRTLQDKLGQKDLLISLGIPTADYLPIRPSSDLSEGVDHAYERFEGRVVFKWSRMGYDGKGVLLAENTPEGRIQAVEFCRQSLARGAAVYAEPRIEFIRELAVVACRSNEGEFDAYPVVVSEQERGICKRVLGPASALGLSPELEKQARHAASEIANATALCGTFALELFETSHGKLVVNEIAPRVHNSGHYTQDAAQADQFENHWRAVLGLGLGPATCAPAFGMINLLGPQGIAQTLPRRQSDLPFSAPNEGLRLHWYAKSEIRPGRKVGHVNAVAQSGAAQDLRAIELRLEAYQAGWVSRLHALQKENSP